MKFSKGLFILILSFLFLFQQELFSFGLLYLVNPIGILPGFYLNDIGLIFPIVLLILARPISYPSLFKCYTITFLYGFIIYLIRQSGNSNLGPEFRLFLSFFTGYSLINFFGKDIKSIVFKFNICFFILNLIILIQFIFLPDFSTWIDNRIGSESIYNLIGPELLLMPTILLISIFTENLRSTKLSIINYFILLIYSILFLKTRSMFLIIILSFIIVYLLNRKMNKFEDSKLKSKKKQINFIYLFMFLLFSFLYLLKLNGDASQMFFDRIGSVAENNSEDTNVQFRLLEPVLVFSDMSIFDFLFGSGLAPEAKLISETGQKYNSMHIGILNILWRFGMLVFIIWLYIYIKFIKNLIYNNLKKIKVGLILIAPSLIIYIILSLVSGGWGVIPFLCLGMLVGLNKIANNIYN